MIDQLKIHLRYNEWASRRLLEAVAQLTPEEQTRDFKTADSSVVGTLAHVFAADRIWLSRVRGAARTTFISPEDRSLELLQRDWPAVHSGWHEVIAAETSDSVLRKIAFRALDGTPYQQPLWQIVLHLVNHGSHHRGQVSGFLRAMGHPPPQLDLITYYRSLG